MFSFKGFYSYTLDGELLSFTPFEDPPAASGRASADNAFALYKDKYLGKGVIAWWEYTKNQKEYYEGYKMLSWIDPKNGSTQRFMKIEDGSLLKNGRAYELPEMSPHFQILDDRLFLLVGTDPYINCYSLEDDYSLLYRKSLDLVNFYPSKGKELNKADPKSIDMDASAGRFLNLKVMDRYLVAGYFQGYNEVDRETYMASRASGSYSEFKNSIEGKYQSFFHIMDLEGNSLANIETDSRLSPREYLVEDDFLWILGVPNKEIEEDFIKLYKVKLE